MVDYIETSPSDRAKCRNCNKKIGKGTPRGVINLDWKTTHYFCYKCAKFKLQQNINELRAWEFKLKQLIKKSKKEIILMELK